MPTNPLPQPRIPPWNWAKAFQSVPIPGWPGYTQSLPSPDPAPDTAPLSATSCPRCAETRDALSAALSLIGRMARSYDFSPEEIDTVEAEIRATLERLGGREG